MDVTGYRKSARKYYGIYLGKKKRNIFKNFQQVIIEIDEITYIFNIRISFWNDCPHIDDADSVIKGITPIREWLEHHRNINWQTPEKPPVFQMQNIAGNHFRLIP
jgi:hypothetical protein